MTFGPYLAANNRILISSVPCSQSCPRPLFQRRDLAICCGVRSSVFLPIFLTPELDSAICVYELAVPEAGADLGGLAQELAGCLEVSPPPPPLSEQQGRNQLECGPCD
jgi:hypothetical protein